ncbi:hypothetical protein AB1Y20_010493 [Prymnesium parvum]|uniref:Nucleoside diphosphate kinase-like domain-containing protein n=1 Tax=Prymnesium parvum TaxID=97485 RepID=A0AB34ISE4_PRYPA
MANRTLAIIKPDAVAAGYAEAIEGLIEKHSFAVLARMELTLSSEQVAELYEAYEGDVDFFAALTAELTSGPVIAMVLEKDNGIAEWLALLGPEDAAVAAVEAPLSIRGMFGSSKIKNAAHGSLSAMCAFRELKLFFPRVFPREVTVCVLTSSSSSSTDALTSAVSADGFLVIATTTVELSKEQAESFYSHLAGSPAFDELVAKLSSGPVSAFALEKPFAVEGLTYLLGPKDVLQPGSLRAKFGGDIHCSESLSAAAKEAAFFFGDMLTRPSETFAWVKPDAFESADAILAEAEAAGFTILASEVHTLNSSLAAEFYAPHAGREFFAPLCDFMMSGPSLALVLSRPCAIAAWRSLLGPTNTSDAKAKFPNSLRAKFGTDGRRNACHGSDSAESYAREAALIFPSLFTMESTLAILTPDAAPHMEQIMGAIGAAGLTVTEKRLTTLAEHRASDLLRLLGPEMPPPAPPPPAADLFFSAWMHSKDNKLLQLYNPSAEPIALDSYALPVLRRKKDAEATWPVFLFEEGKFVPAGGVFVLYDPQCSDAIKAALPPDERCSQAFAELPSGADAIALVKLLPGVPPTVEEGAELPYTVLDCIGTFSIPPDGKPCKPWPVAGVAAASKEHLLLRKPTVSAGNPAEWDAPFKSSQGTNAASSEWMVLGKDSTEEPAHGWSVGSWSGTPAAAPPAPAGSFEACMAHLTSGPSLVLALTGKGAISRWNALLGPVDPTIAKVRCPGCLRARFGIDSTRNVGLGSLNAVNAFQEIKFFFPKALVDPIPSGKQAKDYVAQALTPTLTTGLVELCRAKPAKPVEWLANWLIANNPNAPLTIE